MSKLDRRAAAILRNSRIFLHPYSKTTQGFWIFTAPVIVVDEGAESVGREVLTVLSESREGVPHPESWKGLTAPLSRAAGVRSFNALAEKAKSLAIFLDENGILFVPTLNAGPRRGFVHLKDKAIRTAASDENDVRIALRAAFAACEEES